MAAPRTDTHPRASDYRTTDPNRPDLDPRPFADFKQNTGPEDRGVEANTRGRTSSTPTYAGTGVRGENLEGSTETLQGQPPTPYGSAPGTRANGQGGVGNVDIRRAGPQDGPARTARRG